MKCQLVSENHVQYSYKPGVAADANRSCHTTLTLDNSNHLIDIKHRFTGQPMLHSSVGVIYLTHILGYWAGGWHATMTLRADLTLAADVYWFTESPRRCCRNSFIYIVNPGPILFWAG